MSSDMSDYTDDDIYQIFESKLQTVQQEQDNTDDDNLQVIINPSDDTAVNDFNFD